MRSFVQLSVLFKGRYFQQVSSIRRISDAFETKRHLKHTFILLPVNDWPGAMFMAFHPVMRRHEVAQRLHARCLLLSAGYHPFPPSSFGWGWCFQRIPGCGFHGFRISLLSDPKNLPTHDDSFQVKVVAIPLCFDEHDSFVLICRQWRI